MNTEDTRTADVLVVGSGAGGAAVAGELARQGVRVIMVEAGPAGSGEHVRNADSSVDGGAKFASRLNEMFVPPSRQASRLPRLPGLVGIHGVGGMLVGWTHNCPPPDWSELPSWIDREAFSALLSRTNNLLEVRADLSMEDPRYGAINTVVASRVGTLPAGRHVQPMPTAVRRDGDGGWQYTGADSLLQGSAGNLTIVADHVARELLYTGSRVTGVRVFPVNGGDSQDLLADTVVVAAGTIGSAKLIAASGMEVGPAFGRFLTDHPLAATRVELRPEFHMSEDAHCFPISLWVPGSESRPWSTHVFQGFPLNFNPLVPDDLGLRNTMDIFAFCSVEPAADNQLEFDTETLDGFGLPTVTGRVELSPDDTKVLARAAEELVLLSSDMADLVSGWSMQTLPRGSSMHLKGSCRMGTDPVESVVSPAGNLWGYENCYVAGNAVLGEASSGNPTPASVAFALRTADAILGIGTPLAKAI